MPCCTLLLLLYPFRTMPLSTHHGCGRRGCSHVRAEGGRSSEASHVKGVLLIFVKTKISFLSEAEQKSGSLEQDG